MQRTPWIERKFIFDLPPGWLFNVIERLSGTVPRIRVITNGISEKDAEWQPEGRWCIKQHIGHLSDLETLHDGRTDDFLSRKPLLRAADMNNFKTENADHVSQTLDKLITTFEQTRNGFIKRLSSLDDETLKFVSHHPRLNKPMRPVDMAFFTAEHDDHHLASIRDIVQQISQQQQ